MEGRAKAPAAGTVLNALAAGFGSAFAIDRYVTAEVHLGDATQFTGAVTGAPATDTALIERCVELTVERFGRSSVEGGHVRTESDVPAAGGLKSSSAAANATVLATLEALGEPVGRTERLTRETACRIGVTAARETGVTVTGAFDDASASMLGGVTITENWHARRSSGTYWCWSRTIGRSRRMRTSGAVSGLRGSRRPSWSSPPRERTAAR